MPNDNDDLNSLSTDKINEFYSDIIEFPDDTIAINQSCGGSRCPNCLTELYQGYLAGSPSCPMK